MDAGLYLLSQRAFGAGQIFLSKINTSENGKKGKVGVGKMILGYLAFIMIFAGIAAIIMWIQFGFWWGLVTYLIIGILGIVLLAFLVIKGKK